MSKLFTLMQTVKEEYHIESFAISNQNALVTIFLDNVGGDN